MAEIVKIKVSGATKFNNAEYTNFSTRFADLVTKATTEALGIAEADFAAYRSCLTTMNDLVAQSRISTQTAEMAAADKERDDLVVYLLAAIRTAKSSPLEAQRAAGTELYNLTKPYIGCQNLANQQETATLKGLVMDMRKEAAVGRIKTLGLKEVVDALADVNDRYARLTAERTDEKAANRLDDSKKVRAEMNELYDRMTTLAFVESVAKPTAVTAQFVANLNALIDEVTALYNQRIAMAGVSR